jgi:hypothetical protein
MAGTAPVNPPTGGFGIDGDLGANTPTAGIGDWLPGSAGSGGSVLTAAGVPVDAANTYHLIDLFSSGSDDNFAGGLKFDGNPNGWTWVSNPVNNKEDINNALIHFTTDPSTGHTWVMCAADRLSNNGDAYIDFEFLQGTLTKTGGPTTGAFTSAGPNGGRTAGDFVVTLELTRGGKTPNFFFNRWESVPVSTQAPAGYDYVDRTSSVPGTSVLAAVDTVTVPVTYGAFGGTTYPPQTFAETAVDLTALLGAVDPCVGLNIRTILVKTKESQSPTATITDFVSPLQVIRRLGVANAGLDQAQCSQGASTTFTVSGVATPAPGDVVSSTLWSVIAGTATLGSPGSLSTTAAVSTPSATLEFAVFTSHGCTVRDTVVLTVNTLTASASATPILCHGGTSTVTVSASGAPPYAGTGTFSRAAGTYTFGVTDANGCTATTTITITDPPLLTASSSATVIKCNGGTSTVTVSAAGGTPAYGGTGTFTVSAGSYSFTVTDANGCQATTTGSVSQPPLLTASSGATAIKCNGGTSTVTVSAGGGTAPYSGTGTFTVSAGSYSFTVTDANGCMATTTGSVSEPPLLTASSGATAIKCNGGTSTVTVSAGGGTAPYSGTGTFTVSAGSFSYTVTDANGCTATTTGSVSEPPLLTASSGATAIKCNGGTSTVTVSASGGTAPYSGTGTFTVSAGSFSYTVTDANGCTATTTGSVSEPPLLTASSGATAIKCNGGTSTVTVSASGGTAPYSGTGTFTVSAGSFSFVVTDANGCTATTTGNVSQPPLLTASSVAGAIACNGGASTVTVSAGGGTAPYSGTGTFTVSAGSYSFTVTDANGCTATTTGTVTQGAPLTIAVNSPSVCAEACATLTASVSGGAGPFSYSWSGPNSFSSALNPIHPTLPGTYTVIVTDANGCTGTGSGVLNVQLCLGGGGGLTIGFWGNKNGQAILKKNDPAWRNLLNGLNLLSASPVTWPLSTADPFLTVYSKFNAWLQAANATNMAYMLSAQLVGMELNVAFGSVNGSAQVFVGTPPGNCSLTYPPDGFGFLTVNQLMADANDLLGSPGGKNTIASSDLRTCEEFVKNGLDRANNNVSFNQAAPCQPAMPAAPVAGPVSLSGEETQTATSTLEQIFRAAPNPFASSTTLEYTAVEAGAVHIAVYDIAGRMVRGLVDETRQVGRYSVSWDGRSDRGEALPKGVYFVHGSIAGRSLSTRIVFVH